MPVPCGLCLLQVWFASKRDVLRVAVVQTDVAELRAHMEKGLADLPGEADNIPHVSRHLQPAPRRPKWAGATIVPYTAREGRGFFLYACIRTTERVSCL